MFYYLLPNVILNNLIITESVINSCRKNIRTKQTRPELTSHLLAVSFQRTALSQNPHLKKQNRPINPARLPESLLLIFRNVLRQNLFYGRA
jgi:hypothetical protein